MKSTFAERLKDALKLNNMSAAELCRQTGTPESVMSQYKSGKYVAKQKRLELYSKILDVSIPWLMGEDVPMKNDKTPSNIIPIDNDTEFVNIPVVGRVAAGVTCYADMEIVDYEPTPVDSITPGEEYVYLKVVGDSMYPKFEEGDLVLVRRQTSVDSGSYAVVIIDGEDGVIKKVVYGKDWIELQSVNPMYPPRLFEDADVLRISIYGLVKEIKRKF